MTIIKLKVNHSALWFFISLFVIVLVGGVGYIMQYNGVVDARYEGEQLEKEVRTLEAANINLKERLYARIDSGLLETVAVAHGLVLERTPHYLPTNQWVLDSSY